MALVPIARGLILCERTSNSKRGNISLEECFRDFRVGAFPAKTTAFVAIAHLANGMGRIRFRLVVSRIDTGETVYELAGVQEFEDRLRQAIYRGVVTKLVVAEPGLFEVTLWANDEIIAQTDFRVQPPRGE